MKLFFVDVANLAHLKLFQFGSDATMGELFTRISCQFVPAIAAAVSVLEVFLRCQVEVLQRE